MKKIYTIFTAALMSSTFAVAQNVVDCDASDAWIGYMNVFDLAEDGGGYQFGSPWEVPALKSTIDAGANTVTLQPNFSTYEENAADPYWVNTDTETGNKDLEALTFVEPGDTYNGVDLTFKGSIISNTLSSDYTAVFFIKALDPDAGFADALGGAYVIDIPASGVFTVDVTGAELPAGLIIQYGFAVRGTNANPLAEDDLGSIVIGSASLSAEDFDKAPKLSVYPNPATTDFISFTDNTIVEAFTVMNIAGQSVLNGTNQNMIDVSTLEKGVYLIQYTYLDRQRTLKFIKK